MIISLYIISALVIAAGIVGIFLPLIPGITLMFVGMMMAAIVGKFSFISTPTIVVLAVLTLISFLIDYFSGILGAKYSGASILGVLGAVIGSIFGVSILGPLGVLIGPALGVFLFELISGRHVKKSAKSAGFTLFSTIIGIIINAIIGVAMLSIFLLAIFI